MPSIQRSSVSGAEEMTLQSSNGMPNKPDLLVEVDLMRLITLHKSGSPVDTNCNDDGTSRDQEDRTLGCMIYQTFQP